MNVKLGDIAQLQFGLYTKPSDEGNAVYLQAKHFDDWGNQTEQIDTFNQIDQKNESHLLDDGDIILVGKGMRNFAWTYNKAFGPAIASSIFFIIKADRSRVIPEFLTTLFNMPQTQAYFQTLGAGSSIPSIRKSELEAFMVKLPSLELQQKAIAIKQLHYKDMEISKRIIFEKQRLYQGVINNLINNSMARKTRHVVPNSNGGWDSTKGGAKKASKHFGTKKEAEEYSRELSKKEGSELFIHGKDGKIQGKDSHGNDPFPPKG